MTTTAVGLVWAKTRILGFYAMRVQNERVFLFFNCCEVCLLDSAEWLVQGDEEGSIGVACLLWAQ